MVPRFAVIVVSMFLVAAEPPGGSISLKESLGYITGAITVIGAIVGLTRYITQIQLQAQLTVKEGELKNLQEKYQDLDNRYKERLEELTNVRVSGSAALLKKMAVETDLQAVTHSLGAAASSIMLPEPSPKPNHLVFLCALGPAAPNLRKQRVPMGKGIGGAVYALGKPYVASDAQKDTKFFQGIDKVSKFLTGSMICLPLRHLQQTIGVVQFLNKNSGEAFSTEDLQTATQFAERVSPKVEAFRSDADNFSLLGITPEPQVESGVVLFCDLTASSLLAEILGISTFTDLINAYLEQQCGIAIKYGATIDNYLGDGAMIRFNVPHRIPEFQAVAVRVALEMRAEFEKQKQSWLSFGWPVTGLFSRIGMASGPLYVVNIGHPQNQRMTVMGEAVNVASNLCSVGDRNKNVIVIDDGLYQAVKDRVQIQKLPTEALERFKGTNQAAYELVAMR